MNTNSAFSRVIAFAGWTLLAGCASEPPPRPARIDPSNPAAQESQPLDVAALSPAASPADNAARTAEPADEHQHGAEPAASGHQHGESSPTSGKPEEKAMYTCPMDADVVSDKPGRCPKCGMNLVPKKPAETAPKGKK